MTCLPCSRGTCLTGGKACLATAAGTLDQHLKCGRADPSLALGRGRPEVRGVPLTSTDDCDSVLNEDGIFTARYALQTTGAKCNHGSASIWHRFDSICRQLRCSYSSLQANSVRAWPGPQQLVSTLSWYLRHARRACLRYDRWSQLSLSAPPMCTHDGPASEAETERALRSSNVLYLTWPRWALASVTADACPMRCFATRQRVYATPPCGFAVVCDLRLRYPASVGTLLCWRESSRQC